VCLKLRVKYFFLADIIVKEVVVDLNKYVFPWQVCFTWWLVLD